MELRDYQIENANTLSEIIKCFNIAVFCAEMRTGKTLTALQTAKILNKKNVLFITRLKAISSIEKDYNDFYFTYKIKIANYEQLHKINEFFDFIIVDECHSLGAFPKPSNRVLELKRIANNADFLLMSGTITPESYSQFYHQFYISSFSPFVEKKFYEWHKNYGVPAVKFLYNRQINDYSKTKKEAIIEKVQHLILSYTQEEAGFTSFVEEIIIKLPMPISIKWAIDKLKKDKIITTKEGKIILGDTAVKEMNKTHQLCGGTVKLEDGNAMVIDSSKAEYIKENFAGQKIAIYYKYIAEGEAIRWAFAGRIVQDPEEFNKAGNEAVFISQVQSGREGINLSTADCLIMYNIDFSAVSYWQSRARLQTKDRTKEAVVYWLFFEGGIEQQIYNVVQNKKDFTLNYYKKLK